MFEFDCNIELGFTVASEGDIGVDSTVTGADIRQSLLEVIAAQSDESLLTSTSFVYSSREDVL